MRYWKGSIALSPTRDYPLLGQVLQSGFVTHNQLFEFLKLDYCASSRKAFNNRVLRLVKHDLLVRHQPVAAKCEAIYSVSRPVALELGGSGDQSGHSSDNLGAGSTQRLLQHSLELNEIHLALKRTGSLVYWMPESEVRSRNDLTPCGYWKYYDAVVVVRLAGQDCKFALEYERTPKASRHYDTVCQRIEQEASITHFIYLVPNYDLMRFIADKLSHCKRAVYVGLCRDFMQQTLVAPVRRCGSHATLTLASVLTHGKNLQRSGTLFSPIAV